MKKKYPVLYEWSGKNFSGFSPDVPGCIATGKNLEKIRKELASALGSHLQWMSDDGEVLPQASESATVNMQNDPEFPNPPGYYVIVEWLGVTLPKVKTKRSTLRKASTRELVAA